MDSKDEQIRSLESKVASLELKVASQQKEIEELREHTTSSSSNVDLALVWPGEKVRDTFLNYFIEKQKHTFWKSSSVVPHDDPTLLFANAGMNQYKSIFLGTVDPKLELSTLKRAVNSQKCIRAGGKHNDLDDVGKDTYHHTFFEMLGNWSFGDYFKEEAIEWAFDCLVNVFGLDPSRMYATYFEGDQKQGLAPDLECKKIWEKYLPVDRIIPGNAKDNFWEMGETGPCGPCTEIHYDRLPGLFRPELVNADDPNLIEVWNNVFIQFNREEGGILKELPNKHVDTGMGFERLTSILQDKPSNYDTDVFLPIFDTIQKVTGFPRPYTGKLGEEDLQQGNCDTAYRVVADHIRTLTFAITDGAVPSNDGRGYVLRRVLRRGVRYGQQILGAKPGFFHKLVDIVVENFSTAFPELKEKAEFVKSIISEEEMSFNKTLDKGLKHFNEVASREEVKGSKVFPANEAHFLYASMGFPIDLTILMAEEVNITVDEEGFTVFMDKERELSKKAQIAKKSGGKGKDLTLEAEQTTYLRDNGIDPTESGNKYVWHHEPSGNLLSIFLGRNVATEENTFGFVKSATPDDGMIGIILDRTAFYAEQGGQIYDTGVLTNGNDTFRVENVQLFGGYVLHMGYVESGSFKVEDSVTMMVDYDRRSNIAPNHTMTHVLNYALRKVLLGNNWTQNGGNLCDQKGSSVDAQRLRFDFSWSGPIPSDKLAQIEAEVNKQIQESRPVFASARPLEAARKINSLRSVFNEQYPDPVRVLSVGVNVEELIQDPTNDKWMDYSIEFCGGTHLNNTSEAMAFKIIEETGIAKGIRRITAVTKNAAIQATDVAVAFQSKIDEISQLPDAQLEPAVKILNTELTSSGIPCVDRDRYKDIIEGLLQRVLKFKKEDAKKKQAELSRVVNDAVNNPSRDSPYVIVHYDFGRDGNTAKKAMQDTQKNHPDVSLFIISGEPPSGNIYLYCTMSKSASDAGMSGTAWMTKAVDAAGGGRVASKKNIETSTLVEKYEQIEDVINAAKEYVSSN